MIRSRIFPLGPPSQSLVLSPRDVHRGAALPLVRFADLNLYCRIDVKALYKRLRAAANRASEHFRDADRVLADAVETIGHPSLSAHHRQMTEGSRIIVRGFDSYSPT